jgi:ParB family chromosome partitioning protein
VNSTSKRRLGRGLDALLGRENGGFEASTFDTAELLHLPVDQIDPNPYQPRRHFDPAEIAALADSLRQHGMLQPVIVRQVNERYQLIAGERRLRASIEAQLHEIPARVFDLDDQRVAELAMVENLQREDLNAIEKAIAFRDYLAQYGGTQEELASRLGLDRSTVSNLIRLLDLPEEVRQAVLEKKISQGHARALLGLPDPDAIRAACKRVVAENLSVRQAEALVATGEPTPAKPRVRKDAAEPSSTPSGGKAPHVVELEQQLCGRFGTAVSIRVKARDRGQIVIDFNTQEEFERVTSMIGGY